MKKKYTKYVIQIQYNSFDEGQWSDWYSDDEYNTDRLEDTVDDMEELAERGDYPKANFRVVKREYVLTESEVTRYKK